MRYVLPLLFALSTAAAAQDARWDRMNACGANAASLYGLSHSEVVDRCGYGSTKRIAGTEVLIIGYRDDPARLYVWFVENRAVQVDYY